MPGHAGAPTGLVLLRRLPFLATDDRCAHDQISLLLYTIPIVRKLFFLFVLAALAAAGWFTWTVYSPVEFPAQQSVLLRTGWGTRRIARELKASGVIRSETAFVLWHQLHPQRSLKAGEYMFGNAANTVTVHQRIAAGDIFVHTVVIPEGFTLFDVAAAMEQAGLGTQAQFMHTAAVAVDQISDLAPEAKSLEGFLFPDTYEFTRTETMQDMVGAMVKRFRREAAALGLSGDVLRAVTMGSIVERETRVPEERALVASVYFNRLGRKIALDADPTVIYAHQLAGTYRGALHHDDLQIHSPYNTYKYPGLPPGPIGNPGRAALEAAMHPAATKFLFFVGDGSGHHRFARTLAEHNQNVAKLRRAVAGRGSL